MIRNSFVVRRAIIDDVAVLARHRVEMFRDMGELADGADEPLRQATMEYLRIAMPKGEYVAWVASPDGRSLYEQLGFAPTNEMRYSPG